MFKKLAVFVLFVGVSLSTLFSYTYSTITLSALADKEYEIREVCEDYIVIEVDGEVIIIKKS
ncbi:MAG: hypothetical protein HN334_07250 [Candidatus Cloacimonetes bacterium]|jgi:hypothetical protein|nr:hypothetical protein [Candidatus Cloacimonadota bacterium]MBT7470072.1 hypothetical protein [Candidatus Cloacimonadota bacterium]